MKKIISAEDYTNALQVIEDYKCQCNKCGNVMGDRWEVQANRLKIDLGIDCCSTTALFGDKDNPGFKHPAILDGAGFQDLKILISKGSDYQLCYSCFKGLVRVIGDYIK